MARTKQTARRPVGGGDAKKKAATLPRVAPGKSSSRNGGGGGGASGGGGQQRQQHKDQLRNPLTRAAAEGKVEDLREALNRLNRTGIVHTS